MTAPRVISELEFAALLASPARSAFRLELQPAYAEPCEADTVARFLAGSPEPPTAVPELADWYDQVTALTGAGRRVERVRVHDDPPTGYQQWERWSGQWNHAAGEDIRYLSRGQAHDVGLLPAAGDADWWLLDDARLIVMRFDDLGHRVETALTAYPPAVTQARQWRDLAWPAATA